MVVITRNLIEKFVVKNFSIRKIADELKVSPTTIRWWLKKYDLKTNPYPLNKNNSGCCVVCKKKLTGNQTKYCCNKCKQKRHYALKKNGNTIYSQDKRGVERKLKLIELLGGMCNECGYKKNISALEFHHVNEKEKSFPLDRRSLSNKSWDKILKEFKKCVLLCSNCHREFQYPDLNMEMIDKIVNG